MTTQDLVWGIALTLAVIAALGAWFAAAGAADRRRQSRAFAKSTLLYAGAGFLLGIAFLTSDVVPTQPQSRLGVVAITVGCFLLLYAAGWGLTAENDKARVVVNLTGRPLLLADPALAAFYTLPTPTGEPATELPPQRPLTYYVVTAELGRAAADAGREDLYTVDVATATETREGPLLVRRLLPATRTAPSRTDTPG